MKHAVAICAIVKNEKDYLLEWIAYHRAVGVDYFLIYNNSGHNDDGTTELLDTLDGAGIVDVIPWPDQPNWTLPSGVYLRPQIPAYYDGLERLRNDAEWVAFIDVDEFILPIQSNDLPSTLRFYEKFGGVAANWRMFGSSGEVNKRNVPVCRRFTMASFPENIVNQHVKCITRPKLIRDLSVHRPFLKSRILVDEHGRELTHPYGFRYPVSYDILRINHYYSKSREEWLAKVARGRASHPQKRNENSITEAHFNDERDTAILKFCDVTLQGMRALAEAANILDYPALSEIEASVSYTDAPRDLRGEERDPVNSSNNPADRGGKSETTELSGKPGRVLDVHPVGGLANRMMQYMVARNIAAQVEACRISNARLPAWGINHSLVEGPLGEEISPQRSRHQVDITGIVKALSAGETSRGTFQPRVQWLSNFPEVELCRKMFPADEGECRGFGPEYLVCSLRDDEVLDGSQIHRVLLPIDFYAEMAQVTGLKLVFMGMVGDNAYFRALKRRFPEAIFHSSEGPLADFQAFRNSTNLIVSVSAFSWLAAWLSRAKTIVLPVNGLFHPVQEPNIDLLPIADERYRFYLFPINFAASADRFEEPHRAIQHSWRVVTPELVSGLRTPRQQKRLESFASMFDEAFYLQTYKDIAAAVSKGAVSSGREHYVQNGFREGRNPFAFDPVWYSVAYPAAAWEVGQGEFVDLRHHYVEVGAARGYQALPNQAK